MPLVVSKEVLDGYNICWQKPTNNWMDRREIECTGAVVVEDETTFPCWADGTPLDDNQKTKYKLKYKRAGLINQIYGELEAIDEASTRPLSAIQNGTDKDLDHTHLSDMEKARASLRSQRDKLEKEDRKTVDWPKWRL